MQEVRFDRWRIVCDRQATCAPYALTEIGASHVL
jgi:hypothetical protein